MPGRDNTGSDYLQIQCLSVWHNWQFLYTMSVGMAQLAVFVYNILWNN